MAYGVWGMGYGVWDMGYVVWAMAYGVWGMGYRAWDGIGYGIPGTGMGCGLWAVGHGMGCWVWWYTALGMGGGGSAIATLHGSRVWGMGYREEEEAGSAISTPWGYGGMGAWGHGAMELGVMGYGLSHMRWGMK